ncbi:MAG TPA: glucose 1-dehydrogenase [Acidimicrobiales bacterium]|nr:glucose 1-dehydrogenase [Acidimicrobiales bacterium]
MTADAFRLDGKVALVTGGSRGMGRSIVLGFAEAGADVVIVSRKLESCEKVAREVEESTGQRALPLACHLGYWDQVDELVAAAYDHFGRVDVLVNNAGMSPVYSDAAEISEELYDKVLAVNLKGPFRLTALVGARMAAGDGGSIINVTSHSAVHPDETMITYAGAKAGLNAMTIAFAHALGPKVRVNAIQPGTFLTDISNAWDDDDVERWVSSYALRRAAQPHEVVGTALYLACDQASSFTTGAIVRVDGGNT